MAKKEETPNMVASFAEFKELKNIDKTTMISVLEESFRKVLSNMFGTDENLDVIMNPDKGDVQIFQNLEVVPDGEVENPNLQISLSDARADNDPEVEIGEEHTKEIIFADFGRRAILTLRQTLQSKILELQKERGLTYLFITHNLSVVKHISDDITVMYLGQMVEKAESTEIFEHQYHPYTKALISAIPLPKYDAPDNQIILKGEITSPINVTKSCRFAPRCPYAKPECFNTEPQLEEVTENHFVKCHFVREINGL